MIDSILEVLMKMPAYKEDTETVDERRARASILADSIDQAAAQAACVHQPDGCRVILGDVKLGIALLLAIGQHESNFAQYVHENRCLEGRNHCDADHNGVPRARSPWQLWKVAVSPSTDWDQMGGTDLTSTRLAAWHALVRLAGSRAKCEALYPNPIESMIAGYAGACLRLSRPAVQARARAVRRYYEQIR